MAISGSRHQPDRVLKYPVILLFVLLLVYAVYFSWQSWQEAESEQSNRLSTITELGGNALDTYFSQLEIGMRNLGMDLNGGKTINLARTYTLVSRFTKLHSELVNVLLIRADGQILLTGTSPNKTGLPTLATDPSFRQFSDELRQPSRFVIGRPVVGHFGGKWVISARLGIPDKKGNLAYILSANLPVNMLQELVGGMAAPATVKMESAVSGMGLVRDDGYVVNRYPVPDEASMDITYGKPVSGVILDHLPSDDFMVPQVVEGKAADSAEKSVYAMRRLKHYPLTLYVEMPASGTMLAWWDKVRVPYMLMLCLLAGGVVMNFVAQRRRRIWTLEQRREMLKQNYEQALEEQSPGEIYMFDANTLRFSFANDFALENLGRTLQEMQNITILNLHPELSIESFGALIEPLRKGEQESVDYLATQTRADGSSYPVRVVLQMVSADEDSGFMAIVNDITELRQAEENLRKFNAPTERRGAPGK